MLIDAELIRKIGPEEVQNEAWMKKETKVRVYLRCVCVCVSVFVLAQWLIQSELTIQFVWLQLHVCEVDFLVMVQITRL